MRLDHGVCFWYESYVKPPTPDPISETHMRVTPAGSVGDNGLNGIGAIPHQTHSQRQIKMSRILVKAPGAMIEKVLTLGAICLTVLLVLSSAKADGPAVDPLFEILQQRLVASGFDPEHIESLYDRPEVGFETRGVSLFFIHSEAKLDYDQFLKWRRIRKARAYIKNHRSALDQARKNYGVDPEIITAILLVETQLGASTGRQSVLNILSTMASLSNKAVREHFWEEIDPEKRLSRKEFEAKADRKSEWAFGELTSLLNYVDREQIDPVEIPGSYAGAMGICQFMPSNVLKLAVDGNGDGKVDLFDHHDAIASVGNYLKHHGWRPNITDKRAYEIILRYNYSKPYATTILKIAERLKG